MDDLPTTSEPRFAELWNDLGQGTPTIAAFAHACSISLAKGVDPAVTLSREAKAILFAAKNRGLLEIKASNKAFESPQRLLAVCVETGEGHALIFRSRRDPAYTIGFLAGFRELCAAGLVMHHIYQEFSLTRTGLEMAQTVAESEVRSLLEEGTAVETY